VNKKRGKKDASSVRRDAQGRAHLVIDRDDFGTPRGLALSEPLFEEQWQDDVAVAMAGTVYAMLGQAYTPEQAAGLGRTAMTATSKIVDGALAQSADRPPACRAGCAHCCHQTVGVTAPEVFAIYAYLRTTLGAGALAGVADRVRAADDRTRGLPAAQRVSPEHPCVFLVDNRCSIYEVRPLSCRGTNSLDAAACERNLRDPDAHAAFVAGEASVPCYIEPIRGFHAVTAGLQLALDQLHGLEVLPLELTAAMRIMVDAPEAVPQQWLGGKDPFAAARGGDNTDDPRHEALSGRKRAKRD
jgi:hypothetical protein